MFPIIATTAFGLEAIVARELKALGYADVVVQDGRVRFLGELRDVCRANLWLRSAERVLIEVGSFEAHDFGELFDQTYALPWEEWLPVDAEFPVNGRSVRSQLHSVPDCQRIIKKGVVERLKSKYAVDWFEETGPKVGIDMTLLKDQCTICLDTSGPGLHRRGYRALTGEAPIRETLAAAMIQLSYWNRERLLVDPCCGTGTILIEAALIGRNMAPGLNRTFAAESWPVFSEELWHDVREEARAAILPPLPEKLAGYDNDWRPLKLAREAARDAGVFDDLHLQQRPLSEFKTSQKYGCLITNPPYGERLGELAEVEELYRTMGKLWRELDTWSIYVITSHPRFEALYGRKSERRRKLFNGRIECTYYQYPGPRPPRPTSTDIIPPVEE
ncbi:MAG: class I SAM-dependent RNA methyltransferase [Planctomycetaceae bacterium]